MKFERLDRGSAEPNHLGKASVQTQRSMIGIKGLDA